MDSSSLWLVVLRRHALAGESTTRQQTTIDYNIRRKTDEEKAKELHWLDV